MTKIYLLNNIVVVSTIIIICAIPRCNGVISNKRLCYDPDCNVPVALARTILRYNSIDPYILSFPSNIEVTIFSKEAGRRLDLWGAEILGKRGYIPKSMVREYRKLKSNLSYEVPTEFPEQEVNQPDPVKVDTSSQPESLQNEKVELKDTIDVSQASQDVKNPSVKVDASVDAVNVKFEADKLKSSKDAGIAEPEKSGVDSSSVTEPSPDVQVKEFVEKKAEPILEGIQNAIPPYEVIDGTIIPLVSEKVPIKPSYPIPAVATTAVPNKVPILSVLSNIPATNQPLSATFSNLDTRTVEQPHITQETFSSSNVLAENLISKTDSSTEFPPAQDKEKNSPIVGRDLNEENHDKDDLKTEIPQDQRLTGNIKTLGIIEPAENIEKNVPEPVSPVVNDESSKPETFDSLIKAPDTFANDSQEDDLDATESIIRNSEYHTVSSEEMPSAEINGSSDLEKENENNRNILQEVLDNSRTYKDELLLKNNLAEIVKNESELYGSIPKQEFQDSREQTERLSDETIIYNTKEINGTNSVGEAAVISATKAMTSEETLAHHDNQVTPNDIVIKAHNDNFIVNNVDDVSVETVAEDNIQNDLASEESAEDDYYEYLSGEETSTEAYSDLGEEKSTVSRNLLTVEDKSQVDDSQSNTNPFNLNESDTSEVQLPQEPVNELNNKDDVFSETTAFNTTEQITESAQTIEEPNIQVAPPDVCDINSDCADLDKSETSLNEEQETFEGDDESFHSGFEQHNYLETLLYVSVTAFTTLLFSLGYYYIENRRRDTELVGKINLLEKDLLVTTKESMMLSESLKAAKTKLDSIEDESFGSNEMVLSLKSELEAAQVTRVELEDQIITLEKELESATEAGLELERMLREFLSSQSDENPLAQSVEDLQTRLNAQQATNESLTNSLNLKSQENETLSSELAVTQEKCQELEVEVTRLAGELQILSNHKNSIENDYSAKFVKLDKQINKLSGERSELINQLKTKEMALNDLADVLQKQNVGGLDFEKLYEVSHIKAEAQLVIEERDELKSKITEVEGAHQLLEEHMKLIKEEIASVTKQYELAERDKTEAQTRLEVLSNYFKEKESQLQKELGMQEALWVQKQGEVTSTVDRIQTMQNEIQNYRQQIETLKREILDQEREYKSQISALETKSHEQWVIARQSERRLEESKAEASQLRNRLTMVEKNINEADPEAKLHRLETNGETASSPQLFMGAESSSSPIIFTGSSGVPPPLPPSYLYGGPLPPSFIPPPPHSGSGPMYDISRRPPPLGGRLSSPPPMPLHHPPGRYEDAISPPPPLSPPLHPPYNSLRSPPPLPPFGNERIHPHPPPPPFLPPLGTPHSWGDEPLPPLRNPVFHPHQREQRLRNHKGSLHSSGDSLDKSNHTGKT